MRLAFVIRLGNDTRPAKGLFEGSVEEVDSCTSLRFRSTGELLKFLGQRFELAMDPRGKRPAVDGERAPVVRKNQKNCPARKSKQSPGTET